MLITALMAFDLCYFRKRPAHCPWAFQELTLPCSEPTAQRPSSRDPKEKNYTGARGSCFPVASKKRRRGLCHPPRRSRCAAGRPSRRARLTAATGALRKKKKKRKRERKEKPTLHKVRLGCHERQPDKGFFMDGISIQAAQPFLSGSGVRAREYAPIAGEDSVSQARISRLRAPTSNPLRSPSIPPQSAG